MLECLDDSADTTETGTAAGRVADLLKLMFQLVNRQSTLLYIKIALLRHMPLESFALYG